MAKKIFLSPSDQFGNMYAVGDTNEGTQMGILASLLEEKLVKRGFAVKRIHDAGKAYKVATADSWGADLYVCLHSNACDKKTAGTRIFYWSKAGEGYKAGLKIFNRLAPFTPGTSDGMKQDQSLYEIRNPKAPTVYIECEFHDVPKIAEWIIDQLPEIADKIAAGICDYYSVPYGGRYSVCFGYFDTKADAQAAVDSIKIKEE